MFYEQPGFVFFIFIGRTFSWLLVLGFFSCLFWSLHVCISSLVNNLGCSCINNMFLSVLILGFWFRSKTLFLTKSCWFNDNRSKCTLDFWSMLDYEQRLAFLLLEIWYGLMFMLLGWFWMFFIACSLFSWCLICFCKKFLWFLCFFSFGFILV
jgi:hypothetical protein